jgi:hypothetical protein
MTEESTVSPPEVTTAPRITAVKKTKNPNRVAQGKKLAAIRAEKRRMHELGARDPEPETAETYSDDGYQKMTFYFTLVSSVAALISIPFVYRYLTTSDPPRRTAGPQDRDTAVMTNRTAQAVQTTTPDKQPKKGPASDMIEFD